MKIQLPEIASAEDYFLFKLQVTGLPADFEAWKLHRAKDAAEILSHNGECRSVLVILSDFLHWCGANAYKPNITALYNYAATLPWTEIN